MKRVLLYVRVSTTEQSDRGYSLQDQKAKLVKYCEQNGYEVVAIYTEDYSAKNFDRPQFNKLFSFIKANKDAADYLFIVKWDRFSRNAPDAYEMLKKLKKLNIETQAIEQWLDFSSPESKIMLAIYLTTPEVENDRRSMNVTNGMRRAKLEGRYIAKAPLGYSNQRDESNKPIIRPSNKAHLILEVYQRVAEDRFAIEEIRKEYWKKGLKTSKTNFHKIIRNPLYAGLILVPAYKDEAEQIVKGIHEPIVSLELFEEVQYVLSGRRKKNNHPKIKSVKDNLILRGQIICPECGKFLTGSTSKGKTQRYTYYHCKDGCKARFRADGANREVEQFFSNLDYSDEIQDFYEAILKDELLKQGISEGDEKEVNQKIQKLKDRIENLDDKLADDVISGADYTRIKKRYESEMIQLQKELSDSKADNKELVSQLSQCFDIVKQLSETYSNADVMGRQRILSSTFPQNLIFHRKKVRTLRVNSIVKLLCPSSADFEKGIKKKRGEKSPQSSKVNLKGLEPLTS